MSVEKFRPHASVSPILGDAKTETYNRALGVERWREYELPSWVKVPDWRCTVLSGGVGRGSVLDDRKKVDICKLKCYIYRVERTPQLGLESIRIAVASRIWRPDFPDLSS